MIPTLPAPTGEGYKGQDGDRCWCRDKVRVMRGRMGVGAGVGIRLGL